jgi:hypothetical protein
LHEPHAFLLLFYRRLKRFLQGAGDLRPVIGVDDNRLGQLLGGSRHLAQYKNPLAVGLRRHVFFRDQIHAVPQRRDQADVADRIERRQRRRRHVAILIDHRRPTDPAKAPVYFTDELFDLPLHELVLHDADARGHDHHQQSDLAVTLGIAFQE